MKDPSPVDVDVDVDVDGGNERERVEEPRMSPEGLSEMMVPEIVRGGEPGESVVPATAMRLLGRRVNCWPRVVIIWDGRDGSGRVEEPRINPAEPTEMMVPEIVRAGEPGVSVVPATATALFERRVNGWPRVVMT